MTDSETSDIPLQDRCAICFQRPATVKIKVKQPPGHPTREFGVCQPCADAMSYLEGQAIRR